MPWLMPVSTKYSITSFVLQRASERGFCLRSIRSLAMADKVILLRQGNVPVITSPEALADAA
jgi:hypothetical protein